MHEASTKPYCIFMAIKTVVTMTDDLDGSEAASTVTFGYEGKNYEIDLSDANHAKMGETFAPFIDVARRVRAEAGRRSATPGRVNGSTTPTLVSQHGYNLDDIRTWASTQGLEVADRGRIANSVVEAYHEAQTSPKPEPRKAPAKKAAAKTTARKTAARKATASATS